MAFLPICRFADDASCDSRLISKRHRDKKCGTKRRSRSYGSTFSNVVMSTSSLPSQHLKSTVALSKPLMKTLAFIPPAPSRKVHLNTVMSLVAQTY